MPPYTLTFALLHLQDVHALLVHCWLQSIEYRTHAVNLGYHFAFWVLGFFCSFSPTPPAVTSLTQVYTFCFLPRRIITEIYLLLCHVLPVRYLHFNFHWLWCTLLFFHSCGFPSLLLWFCPWDFSCLLILAICAQCLGMWPAQLPQGVAYFPKYLDFVSWARVEIGPSLQSCLPGALHTTLVNNHLCVSCVSPLVECPDISVPQRWCTLVVLLEQDSHSRLKQELFRKDFAATVILLSISGVLNTATCQVSFRL